MSVQTRLVTADELLHDYASVRCELVEGEVRTMEPAGFFHGKAEVRITKPLAIFVDDHGLGDVVGAETGFKISLDPDTVLAPDVAFVRARRVAEAGAFTGYFPGAPDLAVEVISPSDKLYEVDEKVERYLEAGTLQVWVANPRRKTVEVHEAGGSRVLREGDEVDGGALLPGFRLPVSEIFR